jgi:type I restriction enzyme M protein
VLFIDASKAFEKNKNQNKLTPEHIEKIVQTYTDRVALDKYSYVATTEDLEENEYNLNIPRYVDTFEEEEPVDLDKVASDIQTITKDMKATDSEIAKFCDELRIASPFIS